MTALQVYGIDSKTYEYKDCLRFRGMVLKYVKREENFMSKHYEECIHCRQFIEALDNAKPKQKILNGD